MAFVNVDRSADPDTFCTSARIAGFGWYGSGIGRFPEQGTTTMIKKTPKPRKSVASATKSTQIVGLLKRASGASIAELAKAVGWQEHRARGFISGTLKKKLSLTIVSTRVGDMDRKYQIKAQS